MFHYVFGLCLIFLAQVFANHNTLIDQTILRRVNVYTAQMKWLNHLSKHPAHIQPMCPTRFTVKYRDDNAQYLYDYSGRNLPWWKHANRSLQPVVCPLGSSEATGEPSACPEVESNHPTPLIHQSDVHFCCEKWSRRGRKVACYKSSLRNVAVVVVY